MMSDDLRTLLDKIRGTPFTDKEWEDSEKRMEELNNKEYRKIDRNKKKMSYFSSLTKMERDSIIIKILKWNKLKEYKWNFKCFRVPNLLIKWFEKNSTDKTFEKSLEPDEDFLSYHGVLENWEYTVYSGQGSFHVFKIKDKEYTIG